MNEWALRDSVNEGSVRRPGPTRITTTTGSTSCSPRPAAATARRGRRGSQRPRLAGHDDAAGAASGLRGRRGSQRDVVDAVGGDDLGAASGLRGSQRPLLLHPGGRRSEQRPASEAGRGSQHRNRCPVLLIAAGSVRPSRSARITTRPSRPVPASRSGAASDHRGRRGSQRPRGAVGGLVQVQRPTIEVGEDHNDGFANEMLLSSSRPDGRPDRPPTVVAGTGKLVSEPRPSPPDPEAGRVIG
jgi:hypothetical protein